MSILTNIDGVRARIMALESAVMFDARAWQEVLADLQAARRVSAMADAERRMETARANAQFVDGVDVARENDKTAKIVFQANGHRIWNVAGKRVEAWSDYGHCLRCGHKLSSPSSRALGYGSECRQRGNTGAVIALCVSVETSQP